jgi:hypothetical protein
VRVHVYHAGGAAGRARRSNPQKLTVVAWTIHDEQGLETEYDIYIYNYDVPDIRSSAPGGQLPPSAYDDSLSSLLALLEAPAVDRLAQRQAVMHLALNHTLHVRAREHLAGRRSLLRVHRQHPRHRRRQPRAIVRLVDVLVRLFVLGKRPSTRASFLTSHAPDLWTLHATAHSLIIAHTHTHLGDQRLEGGGVVQQVLRAHFVH